MTALLLNVFSTGSYVDALTHDSVPNGSVQHIIQSVKHKLYTINQL